MDAYLHPCSPRSAGGTTQAALELYSNKPSQLFRDQSIDSAMLLIRRRLFGNFLPYTPSYAPPLEYLVFYNFVLYNAHIQSSHISSDNSSVARRVI